jgi:type VII secretion-associated serine protease mycosin
MIVVAGLAVLVAPVISADRASAETVRDAQWFLRDLKIDQAHQITKGSGVTVAVVDSGIEADHPDLKGQVSAGTATGGTAGDPLNDDDGHGTAMAGLIAAKGGGANNALGIAPGAKLLSAQVSGGGTGFRTDQVAAGIRWAVDNGAKVINLSLGSQLPPPSAEVEAVNYALSKDVVVVAAAGNREDGITAVASPANIPGVVAVGATGEDGAVLSGSVPGPELGIVAPGGRMATTGSRRAGEKTGYVVATGTSPAAAVVTGVVALIRSKYPNLRAPDVINRLVRTADDLGPAGRDPASGFGRVNPLRALSENVANTSINPLGQPSAAPSNQVGAAPEDYDIRPRSWWQTRMQIVLVGALIVLAVLIAVPVLLMVRSSRRRKRTMAAAPWGPYGSGSPPPRSWPGHPPVQQPPTGGWPAYPPGSGATHPPPVAPPAPTTPPPARPDQPPRGS